LDGAGGLGVDDGAPAGEPLWVEAVELADHRKGEGERPPVAEPEEHREVQEGGGGTRPLAIASGLGPRGPIEYFLERYARRNHTPAPGLTEEATAALQQYSFPGNVRELEHLMERAAVQASGRAITVEQIQGQLLGTVSRKHADFEFETLLQLPFHDSVAEWEKRLIENALKASGGNKSDAARSLGIHRRLLYEKLQQFGIG
jgi:DNA-binding protein Fis